MRVLVACEFSGIVREAFRKLGHDAVSCDLLPTEQQGPHIQDDVLKHLGDGWDLMIAHPPCTHLSSSGAAWFEQKCKDGRQQQAIDFFMKLTEAPIPRIAIENPVGIMSKLYRKPDQIIQPYQFGHTVKKATCLWLKNLPLLKPTEMVEPEITTLKTGAKFSTWDYKISMNHKERSKLRSVTFPGIAQAMAEQWGNFKPLQTVLLE
jgi:site-specific DNA-cytosine methylase